jgi:hypothetical protein
MMARKILNRRELRQENDAFERSDSGEAVEELLGADARKAPKKAPAKRKPRTKTAKEVRLKAFWGVFSQSLAQVAQYEYAERPEADKRAADLTESKKTPHFVQLVKKVIEE